MNTKIYFGTSGITSTSANTVANWAKEYVKNIPTMSFVNKYISLIGDSHKELVSSGINNIDTAFLKKKAKAYSLIAWIREAIKAKEKLIKEIETLGLEEYCVLKGITYPQEPVEDHILTEEEYWDSKSTKERNKYYELETSLSVLGKFIHPEGNFANARDYLQDKINNPIDVSDNGRDTIITRYEPSISLKDVESKFFELQAKHRELQSQLNAMKYECEKACIQSETEVKTKYQKEYNTYNTLRSKLYADLSKYKRDQVNEIIKLKIIIPDSLQEIFKEVSQLGKNI